MMTQINNYLEPIIKIAIDAGQAILEIRHQKNLGILTKSDLSPVTLADFKSHEIITKALTAFLPDIPIISEENDAHPEHIEDLFFLIDPLDGTKDFIEGSPEFCVNIALMSHRRPVMGIVYIPCTHQCYYAILGQGSHKIANCDAINAAEKIYVTQDHASLRQIISKRSHAQSYLKFGFDADFKIIQTLHAGSAIKFCYIAEGQADIYPRIGQTGEWDTAAGDIIVTEAGGFVGDRTHQPIIYGKYQKNYLNDAFYAANCIMRPSA